MLDAVNNFAKTTITGIASGVTTVTLTDASKFGDPASVGEYNCIIWENSSYANPADDPNVEIVRVTAKSGSDYTITRAQESTADADHNTGGETYAIANVLTAKMITDLIAANLDIQELGTATYDSIQDYININSSGYFDGFTISDGGSGTIDIAAGKGYIKSVDSDHGLLNAFDYAGTTGLALADNDVNYIYIDYNSGTPIAGATTDRSSISTTDAFTIGRVHRSGTTLKIVQLGIQLSNFPRRDHERLINRGMERMTGSIISEVGTSEIAVTAGTWYLGLNKVTTAAKDISGTDTITLWYHSSGNWATQSDGSINVTQYDNGTDLASLGTNKYGTRYIYVDYYGDLHYVIGDANDASLVKAQGDAIPSLPEYLQEFGAIIGKIIVREGETAFSKIDSAFKGTFCFASPTSADDLTNGTTGTGAIVLADTPTLITPNIGSATASALNITGLTASQAIVTDASKNLVSKAIGISDDNIVEIDSSSIASGEYAKFTANGLESRSTAEVLSDIGALAVSSKASSSEINTGTDNNKYITSDALAGSNAFTKTVEEICIDFTTNLKVADGVGYFIVPAEFNGMNLISARADVITAGTTNATTFDIYNVTDSTTMLSSAISIASGNTSGTGTVDTSHDDVATGDKIRIDVDSVSTTAPKGLIITLSFRLS